MGSNDTGTNETDALGLGRRNQSIAHESVAIVNNTADLFMKEAFQRAGLRIATGKAKGTIRHNKW